MNARIRVEVINDAGEHEDWGVEDLNDPKRYQSFVLGFGNGLIEEMRVLAEARAGIFMFVNLLERGGYVRGEASQVKGRKLFKEGDVCYPAENPFIFISPRAENGDFVNFADYRAEVAAYIQSVQTDCDPPDD